MTEVPASYVLKVLAADGSSVRRFQLPPGRHGVGSAPENEVRLEEAGVSRRHARIDVLADGGVVVSDLASKNGTFVGGRKVKEIALSGFSGIAFGSVQGVLQPADPEREQVLLGPPAQEEMTERRGARASPPLGAEHTTQGLHPLERLAESLGEILPPLVQGLATPEETAAALAHRWIEVLPVGRVEFLRVGTSGPAAVLAAASTVDRFPKSAESLDVNGPDGWTVRLRAPASAPLRRLEPLLRLVLELLTAGSGPPPGWRVSPVRQRRGEGGREAEETPVPAGLGQEMTSLYGHAGKVAHGEISVMILGESGSGKEVLARWIHARSRRAAGPFLAVNCAALPRELLEAELFGIERGVATGVDARPGLLERCSGGTVFLDEVGDMAAEIQAKVLRVLESTQLYRVGGRQPLTVDVRFVAATNRDLSAMVEEGTFRRDLFHRLAAFEVKLPPLRERREEIPSLAARFFYRELEKHGRKSPGITRAALGALIRHPWPGNIRELQNEIGKAVLLLEPGEPLDPRHLSERIRRGPEGAAPDSRVFALEAVVSKAEREAFAVALAAAEGDAARAMDLLGVSKTTYYRKLKELGIGS